MSLRFEQVSLVLGGAAVLHEIDLACGPGITWVIGPNGSGKTCLCRVAAGVMRPSRGRLRWWGLDAAVHPFTLKDSLGYLPQRAVVYPDLDGRELLCHLALLKGIPRRLAAGRARAVLQLVGMEEQASTPAGRLSPGRRRLLGLAQALLNDPYLLVLDQPTAGLAPETRIAVMDLIRRLASGKTVLLATHDPSAMEPGDRVACLEEGRLTASGPAGERASWR
ncbi:MAG: ATP-binding cassette domain-containing protein [bacterium]|nr:ATP-binding cassette domain-containing protein [bacterium]